MVTLDVDTGTFGEVLGEMFAPSCEVCEDQDSFFSCEHRIDNLVEPGELPTSTFELQVVRFFVVVEWVVAYLL